MIIPVSCVIPTYNRLVPLRKALISLSTQNVQFKELIIIDASDNHDTEELCKSQPLGLGGTLIYQRAHVKGAATQRNEGVAVASQPFIAFMDDDVYLEDKCLERLWLCLSEMEGVGGVSAMITNQKYHPVGALTRLMCRLLSDKKYSSYAGKCIGPAWNFLPSDDPSLPKYVEVDWLNLGLTIYPKKVLPSPPFQKHFEGYSMMEDLTLSLVVGKTWKLYNARTARIFHDSQPGNYKSDFLKLQQMATVNRYFTVRNILGKSEWQTWKQLILFELFQFLSLFRNVTGAKNATSFLVGKILAINEIRRRKLSQ